MMIQAERDRKMFRVSLVLNAVIMSTFLALNTIANLARAFKHLSFNN
jgi:hypothetical protein